MPLQWEKEKYDAKTYVVSNDSSLKIKKMNKEKEKLIIMRDVTVTLIIAV